MKRISMKDARICADMNEKQACDAMKIQTSTLISWEYGTSSPTVEQALKMAEVYGLPIDVISFLKEDNTVRFCNGNLKRRILAMFESKEAFAKAVKMKPETLEKRLSGESFLTKEEICKMRKQLCIGDDEVDGIFFCEEGSQIANVCKLISLLTDDEYETLQEIVKHGRPGVSASQI